ncbi:unnamed protein product [Brassica oleracea]
MYVVVWWRVAFLAPSIVLSSFKLYKCFGILIVLSEVSLPLRHLTLGLIFFPFHWHQRGFSRSLFLICASVLKDRLMVWSWRSRVVLRLHGFSVLHSLGLSHPCTNIGLSAGSKSLKDFKATFVSNPSLLVILCSERHSVFGKSSARCSGWVIIFKSGSSEKPKLLDSDFRLNLVHSSAASGWF